MPLNGEFSDDFFRLNNLTQLHLAGTGLRGRLPENVCTAPSLRYLWVYNNTLTGEVPACLMDNAEFRMLNLAINNFTGPFPNITRLPLIESARLNSNFFSGMLPQVPYDLPFLQSCSWANNSLTGPLPDISGMTGLSKVQIQGNHFCGPIPPSIWRFLPQEEKDMNSSLTTWKPCNANDTEVVPYHVSVLTWLLPVSLGGVLLLLAVVAALYVFKRRTRTETGFKRADEDQEKLMMDDQQGLSPLYPSGPVGIPAALHNQYIVHHENPLNPSAKETPLKNSVFRSTLYLPGESPIVVICKHCHHTEYENHMSLNKIAAPHVLPLLAASQERAGRGRHDIGPNKKSRSDAPFIVTRYIEDGTLTQLIRQGASIPLEVRKNLVCQFIRIVQTLFTNSRLHSDLKSDNLLIENAASLNPELWLVDLQPHTHGTRDARDPALDGPDRRHATAATEVYACGRVVFELLFLMRCPIDQELREREYQRHGLNGKQLERFFDQDVDRRFTQDDLLTLFEWIQERVHSLVVQQPEQSLTCDGFTSELSSDF